MAIKQVESDYKQNKSNDLVRQYAYGQVNTYRDVYKIIMDEPEYMSNDQLEQALVKAIELLMDKMTKEDRAYYWSIRDWRLYLLGVIQEKEDE